jgi:hypothetical protein
LLIPNSSPMVHIGRVDRFGVANWEPAPSLHKAHGRHRRDLLDVCGVQSKGAHCG